MLAWMQFGGPTGSIASVVIAMVVVLFVIIIVWASRYRKAPPNKALLVSGGIGQQVRLPDGRQLKVGFRLIRPGGGTFIWPVIERADLLSMELLPVSGEVRANLSGGGRVQLSYTAQVKVGSDEISIALAAERMLSKPPGEIVDIARQILEDSLRRTLEIMQAGEVRGSQAATADRLRAAAAATLGALGLAVEHLVLTEVAVDQ